MMISGRHILAGVLLAVACGIPAMLHRDAPALRHPAPVRVQLLFAGDVMQHMPQVVAARHDDGFDYAPVFAAVKPLFDAADLTVVNLETTLTRTKNYTGYPCFRSPVALAGALRDAGVDVAVMANNHCCDAGANGVRTTAEVLDSLGIRRTGVFADSIDYKTNNPLYLVRSGICFALLNYTYSTNGMPVPQGVAVNAIDTVRMAADLEQAHRGGAECTVVCIHWGNEYQRRPDAVQRRLARFLREHGADLVIGSHPHVVQPFEANLTGAVFYSLGNFVSNQRQRHCDGGLMARIEVTRRADGSLSYRSEAIPVWVALPGYRILPPAAADTLSLPPAYGVFRSDVDALLGSAL